MDPALEDRVDRLWSAMERRFEHKVLPALLHRGTLRLPASDAAAAEAADDAEAAGRSFYAYVDRARPRRYRCVVCDQRCAQVRRVLAHVLFPRTFCVICGDCYAVAEGSETNAA